VVIVDVVLQYSPMCVDHPWRPGTGPAFHWWTSTSSLAKVSETVSIIHYISLGVILSLHVILLCSVVSFLPV